MSETATIDQVYVPIGTNRQTDLVRAPYSNRYANSINYVIPVLKSLNLGSEAERSAFFEIAVSGALVDIYTQIIEHPLSETTARYEYDLTWNRDGEKWKLIMGGRTLDETYEEAMSTRSGQIPEFEIERNKVNYSNYDALRNGRKAGETRTFVEFSPSPVLTEEARNRGYFGNDTIFFFVNENGVEKVVQRWLPASSIEEYTALLKEVGGDYDESGDNPISVMSSSGFLDNQQVEKVLQFVDQKTRRLEEVKVKIIEEHANSFIWRNVSSEFRVMIAEAARKLARGENISDNLSQLSETMAVYQFGFRKFIHDVMVAEVGVNYSDTGGFSEFQKLDRCVQIKTMSDSGYTMTACGVSEQFGSFGKSSSITNPSSDLQPSIDRPDPVKCDICKRVIKYVKNGDPSTYDADLKCCGKSYGC